MFRYPRRVSFTVAHSGTQKNRTGKPVRFFYIIRAENAAEKNLKRLGLVAQRESLE